MIVIRINNNVNAIQYTKLLSEVNKFIVDELKCKVIDDEITFINLVSKKNSLSNVVIALTDDSYGFSNADSALKFKMRFA